MLPSGRNSQTCVSGPDSVSVRNSIGSISPSSTFTWAVNVMMLPCVGEGLSRVKARMKPCAGPARTRSVRSPTVISHDKLFLVILMLIAQIKSF